MSSEGQSISTDKGTSNSEFLAVKGDFVMGSREILFSFLSSEFRNFSQSLRTPSFLIDLHEEVRDLNLTADDLRKLSGLQTQKEMVDEIAVVRSQLQAKSDALARERRVKALAMTRYTEDVLEQGNNINSFSEEDDD